MHPRAKHPVVLLLYNPIPDATIPLNYTSLCEAGYECRSQAQPPSLHEFAESELSMPHVGTVENVATIP